MRVTRPTRAQRVAFLLVLAGTFFWAPMTARASAVVPTGFAESLFASDLPERPTAMKFAGDGRIFVAGQGGEIVIVKDGVVLPRPFLRLNVESTGERGLIGLALDPDFESNGYVYVHYTVRERPIHGRISRFTAAGDVAVPSSEFVLLDLDPQPGTYHLGGGLAFGPDGTLYVGVGENDRGQRSQLLTTLLGKVLRIEPDGSIPTDNPFYAEARGDDRAIWAIGLRNPFSLAIDPKTGTILINDTGEDVAEEINLGTPGGNYGWPDSEGYHSDTRYEVPLHAYGHGVGEGVGCAINAGAFYNPETPTFPTGYVGQYFFIDYCGDWIRALDLESRSVTTFARGLAGPNDRTAQLVALEVGPDAAIYWINRAARAIYRIQYTGQVRPQVGQQPAYTTLDAGAAAVFEVRASGEMLTYQWQRNFVDIPGATEPVLTLPAVKPEDSGARFRCIVSNPLGTVTSDLATLTVIAPSARYDATPPTRWAPGETRTYEVTVTNTGSQTWNASGLNIVRLGVQFGSENDDPNRDWATDQRFSLPDDLPAGGSVAVTVSVTAPDAPGSYVLRHRMIKEDVAWFDDVHRTSVEVGLPAPTTPDWLVAALIAVAAVTAALVVGFVVGRRAGVRTAARR